MSRKLLHPAETQISCLQIIGFIIIISGIVYLFVEQLFLTLSAEVIAADFFVIMLGIVFAFPDLLRDSNKGLSTMRISVFMMINVICILLLKIGWGKGSLTEIGLNQYWMGVIAFVFGAKATQTYFESKLTVPPVNGVRAADTPGAGFSQDQLIQMAIDQNKAAFTHPNVTAVMHGKMLRGGQLTDCVTVHLSNQQKTGYPASVTVHTGKPDPVIIYVDYITGVNVPKVNGSTYAGGPIANSNTPTYKGTVCCRLQGKKNGAFSLLTCSHVMNNGSASNDAGPLQQPQPAAPFGTWAWGMRTADMDAALIAISPSDQFTYPNSALAGRVPRDLTSADMLTTSIFMAGRDINTDQLKTVQGKITNYNSVFPIDIGYSGGNEAISNLIVLSIVSAAGDNITYQSLSVEGDSGALVYDGSYNPIGMVIAGNDQFTYAIPLNTVLLNSETIIA
jgi:hypothetical protein